MPQNKQSANKQFLAFTGVDSCAARMRLHNLVERLRKQSRAHVVNAGLLIMAIGLLLLWQAKFTPVSGPKWLLGFELHLSIALVLMLIGTIFIRFSRGVAAFQGDWQAVQPIAWAQRIAWLRATIAARVALELVGCSILAAGLCGVVYGVGVLVFGAGLSVIALILLAHSQRVRQAKNARRTMPSLHGNTLVGSNKTAANTTERAKARDADPFSAWFASAIPRLSKLRWWWLIPLLSLPMGSNVVIIAAIFAGFLALSRFASVCSALSLALADISKLTHTTPLKPAKLYRAALIFSTQGVLILVLMVIAIGLSPARFNAAVLAAIIGLLLLMTALHFGFGYRLQAINSAARNRASLVIALILGLTASSTPLLLALACPLLWLWLYRRGIRCVSTHLDSY